jgi:hypothetical protein
MATESVRRTICFAEISTETHNVILCLINGGSEILGQFLDSDFALLHWSSEIAK